ncbi:hypothetical protein PHYBLDRAFT_142861 [Phycomyces blakesleeanus NRRL 1555(-)]|uniref:Uncharacterized protein n=1 Tax=Phycomyces blakesleeanus (strain ATCC 8743b / DSM 1359 / FGSC 10004 / NBRC 33097 / NRRL 1555) TaxID=763407 RepID=A0A162PTL8_PHYB8|nr:hypothetical protein PHYBLDRAFT_142861 [Phycomyces blakesleeanus NRRL 1555(-)]OAD75877.1 hypothetical protein PHYBLDRAFT_142861 [Phycomyces blakesleeanus NRRL 1555(-)]|eukprot:XP_018293917.1 hypothetical protein PHYBLDRAFT_142861 [Phycomyces blakesleeanus NRRL 1555(-)]
MTRRKRKRIHKPDMGMHESLGYVHRKNTQDVCFDGHERPNVMKYCHPWTTRLMVCKQHMSDFTDENEKIEVFFTPTMEKVFHLSQEYTSVRLSMNVFQVDFELFLICTKLCRKINRTPQLWQDLKLTNLFETLDGAMNCVRMWTWNQNRQS